MYWMKYHLSFGFFCPRQTRPLSSVSSVENDKHLIIFKIHGFSLRTRLTYSGSSFSSSTPCTYILGVGLKLGIDTLLHPQPWVPFPVWSTAVLTTWKYAIPERWGPLGNSLTTLGMQESPEPWECVERSPQSLASTFQCWHMSPRPLRGSDLPPMLKITQVQEGGLDNNKT